MQQGRNLKGFLFLQSGVLLANGIPRESGKNGKEMYLQNDISYFYTGIWNKRF